MLKHHIQQALIEAMKQKNANKVLTLRMVNSAIKDKEIALRGKREDMNLTDEEILAVLKTMVKTRENSIIEYRNANREDRAQVEQAEIDIIQAFLPTPYSEAELEAIISKEVTLSADKSIKALKDIIANLRKREDIAKIDMGIASKLIKDKLQ